MPPKTTVTVTLGSRGWRVGSTDLGTGELTIEPDPPASVSIDGRTYRGTFHLVPTKTAFDVVNHVPVDDYLRGVLAAELYPEFHPEAYKAQAVVARTYAIFVARTTRESQHYDLHADVRSQMYGGVRTETAKSTAAVAATAGLVVAYGPPGQAKIFKAYYSSCCGGATMTAQEAFGEPAFEPFTARSVGRRCDIVAGKYHARFDWSPLVIGRDELARRFKSWGHQLEGVNGVQRIDVYRTTAAGRPTHFSIEDARGTKYVIGAEQFRVAVNTGAPDGSKLASAFVSPVADGQNIRFQNGHGFGHGVGMCQWCIEAEARQGMTYEQIVRDAYHGAVLVKGY
jgi:stage II sporulation protein D